MRILIDSLIALMLVAVVTTVVMLQHGRRHDERSVAQSQNALRRLHDQAAYHSALQSAMSGHDTLLVHMHEQWFGEDLPTNALVSGGRPWIDLAPPGDLGVHPPDPVATEPGQAGFWYNPTTGVFRARVAPGTSEAQTLALYNEVNATSLERFEQIPDPARRPIAHEIGTTPARQYASMANRTWSEPKQPTAEQTDRVFAPLIDPVQKSALVQTVQELSKAHGSPGQDAAANTAQATRASEDDAQDGQAGDSDVADAVADVPITRPRLEY